MTPEQTITADLASIGREITPLEAGAILKKICDGLERDMHAMQEYDS